MRYALLIYSNENRMAELSAEEQQTMMADYFAFMQAAGQAGVLRGGEALEGASTATTVRVRDDKTLVTDGPFAETKEQVGGYYIVECSSREEALVWAAKLPGAKYAPVEVRPIMELS